MPATDSVLRDSAFVKLLGGQLAAMLDTQIQPVELGEQVRTDGR